MTCPVIRKLFEKKLNEGDIKNGLVLDSDCEFAHLPGFMNDNGYVEFYAVDEKQMAWRFRCFTACKVDDDDDDDDGVEVKPMILEGWIEFVGHYGLKAKDKVILYYNEQGENSIVVPFVIHVRRTIRLFGVDITESD